MSSQYRLVTDPEDLRRIYNDLAKHRSFVAWDTETHGPLTEWVKVKKHRYVWEYTAEMTGFSFAFGDKAFYIPVAHKGPNMPKDVMVGFLKHFFALPNRIFAHNINYDARVIHNYVGEYLWAPSFGDTMVLTWLVGAGVRVVQQGKEKEHYDLKRLTKFHFNYEMQTYEQTVGGNEVPIKGLTDEEIVQELAAYTENLVRSQRQLEFLETTSPNENNRTLNLKKLDRYDRALVKKLEKDLIKSRVYREAQMNDLTGEHVLEYAAADAYWSLQLAIRFWPHLERMNYVKQWDGIEMPMVRILRDMHDVGLSVDPDAVRSIRAYCEPIVKDLADQFHALTGALISSNQQCVKALYHDMKLFPTEGAPRTPSGHLSVAWEALQWAKHTLKDSALAQKIIDIKLRHSELSKIMTTYTDALIKQLPYSPDGRIRPSYHQCGTRTGRLASSNPNAQNFPRPSDGIPDIRAAVRPAPGYVMAAIDFSQIEVILAAHYSKDSSLTDIILSGKSMHDVTSEALGIERSLAKTINFCKQYGGGAKKVAQALNIPLVKVMRDNGEEMETAPDYIKQYCDKYDELYSGIIEYRRDMSDYAAKNGYVQTILGRRRNLPELRSLREQRDILDKRSRRAKFLYKQRAGQFSNDELRLMNEVEENKRKVTLRLYHSERIAANTPIQGSAADIIKLGMVTIWNDWRNRGYKGRILSQIHDELLLELPADGTQDAELANVQKILEGVIEISLPIKAVGKIAGSWSECK